MSTLSVAIRKEIDKHFEDGESITSFYFYSVCEQYGKHAKSATHILRDLANKGLLEQIGEQTNRHGGGKTKRYIKVPGEELTQKTARDYQREAAARAANMNRCQLSLQSVLDNITRRRTGTGEVRA